VTVKFLSLAIKALKQTIRDRRSLLFLLLFPVVFMIIFAFAFGSPSSLGTGTTPHEIAVFNLDRGATVSINNTIQHINSGASLTQLLGNVKYAQTDTHMFQLNNVSADQAQTMLKSRGLDAVITIPENFSQAVVSLANASARAETTSDIGLQVINESTAQNATSSGQPLSTSALSLQLPVNTTLRNRATLPHRSSSKGIRAVPHLAQHKVSSSTSSNNTRAKYRP
jgi:ABC-2 type transport system permease protein